MELFLYDSFIIESDGGSMTGVSSKYCCSSSSPAGHPDEQAAS